MISRWGNTRFNLVFPRHRSPRRPLRGSTGDAPWPARDPPRPDAPSDFPPCLPRRYFSARSLPPVALPVRLFLVSLPSSGRARAPAHLAARRPRSPAGLLHCRPRERWPLRCGVSSPRLAGHPPCVRAPHDPQCSPFLLAVPGGWPRGWVREAGCSAQGFGASSAPAGRQRGARRPGPPSGRRADGGLFPRAGWSGVT